VEIAIQDRLLGGAKIILNNRLFRWRLLRISKLIHLMIITRLTRIIL